MENDDKNEMAKLLIYSALDRVVGELQYSRKIISEKRGNYILWRGILVTAIMLDLNYIPL